MMKAVHTSETSTSRTTIYLKLPNKTLCSFPQVVNMKRHMDGQRKPF
jgi:hypothetical protein